MTLTVIVVDYCCFIFVKMMRLSFAVYCSNTYIRFNVKFGQDVVTTFQIDCWNKPFMGKIDFLTKASKQDACLKNTPALISLS